MRSAALPVQFEFDERFCSTHTVNLTAGCSFGCLYCPFEDIEKRRRGVERPTAVDLSPLVDLRAPSRLYLSGASDAFAPQAAPLTHALLERVLPEGTSVVIVTKGIIPERTLDLLADHRAQIEGIAVGVTSLDDERNRVVEPGCPPARDRLENVNRIADRRLTAALRVDPMFPDLDDRPEQLATLADQAARRGARGFTATYIFAWGRYLTRMRREPLLAPSCALLTETAPMEGGRALSVPLARKLQTYRLVADLARERGMHGNTCGCKDLRIRTSGVIDPSCRNPAFLPELPLAQGSARSPTPSAGFPVPVA